MSRSEAAGYASPGPTERRIGEIGRRERPSRRRVDPTVVEIQGHGVAGPCARAAHCMAGPGRFDVRMMVRALELRMENT